MRTPQRPFSQRIEDYALIGNCASAALVGRNGSIDWLAIPRFDSDACFAALLGTEDNGRWLIAPAASQPRVTRRYQESTLALETEFATAEGRVVLIDCMARDGEAMHVLRLVRGLEGSVPMRMEMKIRFEYGKIVPWVTRMADGRLRAIAGPDLLVLATPVEVRGEDLASMSDFTVHAGEELPFALTWCASHLPVPDSPDVASRLNVVAQHWREWCAQHRPCGEYNDAVLRSLITLKALTHHQTGGIVAAATTSLPEVIGGSRNWDYRFCWLRDATLTLFALLNAGFTEEAKQWRDWLIRAVAGSPNQLQIMYGISGERRLKEFELPWLGGYENSQPVRIGNAASEQLQLDVYGEVLDLLYQARRIGIAGNEDDPDIQRVLADHLAEIWEQPDEGIWEIRGEPRHFTHSKVMAWVALDRAIRMSEEFGGDGPVDRWRSVRDRIHEEVCERGFNAKLNSFTQFYGSDHLDASLLLLPLVGFLAPADPRIRGTVEAVERELLRGGFVRRYDPERKIDGLHEPEGAFLACSFWLADNYILQGRRAAARELFERLLALRNDVGLLSEEYDVSGKRFLGNFPQGFSHVGIINTAHNLTRDAENPAQQRSNDGA